MNKRIKFLGITLLGGVLTLASAAAEPLRIYGPGGPAPAMQEAAEAFETLQQTEVEVVFGPADEWMEQAREDAHLVYSGAEFMMNNFVEQMEGQLDGDTATPLYLRPSAILVRPGNPRNIRDFDDLLAEGVRVMVVNGAGQVALWEDMAAKQGDIEPVRALRRNIVEFAPNSGAALDTWREQEAIDAWIIWNHWQIANPEDADLVEVGEAHVIYRPSGIALTERGKDNPRAQQFVDFLMNEEGAAIFRRWGWMTEPAA